MEITYKAIEELGFRELGNRPIWSNGIYQLHQYTDKWCVFKKQDNNVLYIDTGLSINTIEEVKELINTMYQILLIWNRGFHWSEYHYPFDNLTDAIKMAQEIINSGDGARVKKAQIINTYTGKIEWNG